MAQPRTRKEFKEYCLRSLGFPVIEINVDDDQVEDRIDESIQFWHDYHFDGTEKLYMKHQITQADKDRRWIYCPDAVIFVTGVVPFDSTYSSLNMFDMRYQLRLHDLYDFTSVSYVSYEITMMHLRTLELLFAGTPQFRFHRHQNKLFVDHNWDALQVGEYILVECYRRLEPVNITLTGTLTGNIGNTILTGSNTVFDQEIVEGDFLTLSDGQQIEVFQILSPTYIKTKNQLTANISNVTMIQEGCSDIWNDRWLKKYTTALIKRQWGNNLSKYAGIQMPGGVTLDGVRILTEAQMEIDKLEEEMHILNVLPGDIFMG